MKAELTDTSGYGAGLGFGWVSQVEAEAGGAVEGGALKVGAGSASRPYRAASTGQ